MATSTNIALPPDWRRRSADVGGLHLALASGAAAAADHAFDHVSADEWEGDRDNDGGAGVAVPFGAQGQGWMGGEGGNVETMYAELLSDMYNETLNSVNDNSLESPPPAVPEHVRSRLIWSLSKWHFEPHKLPDEEVLACTLILFEALFRVEGMQEAVPLSMEQITAFIHHLRRIYRYENKYHNFEHALDVLQATQSYLKSAGIVPPPTILLQPADRRWVPEKRFPSGSLMASLGKRELFMLYIGAIGHDVGHPGFSNMFMKNAQAPLAMLFTHGSALEHMHCQLLLRVMRYHGFHVLLDDPLHGSHLRKLLHKSVLATDMGVHEKFMQDLQSVVDGAQMSICERQVILCQAILKNADISNPTRPFLVSKHWASALVQEWTAQAHLEEEYHLAQTVPVACADPIKEADSQIFFIRMFAKPLLELTQRAVPEMCMYLGHCKTNLKTWIEKRKGLVREREEEEEKERVRAEKAAKKKGVVPTEKDEDVIIEASPSLSHSASSVSLQNSPPMSPRPFDRRYHTAFPLTLPPPPSTTTSSASSSSGHSPALSVPDSPNTETSECRSVASSSFSHGGGSGVFSPISESSTALNVSVGQPSFLSVPQSSSTSASANASSHAAIRAAGKVGTLRKKSQTGLNNKLPPLPTMLAASLSASSSSSSSSSSSTSILTSKKASGSGSTSQEKSGSTEKKTRMNSSFRFKSSARNSWCASTGLSGLFHASGHQRDASPLPPGKESWVGKGKEKEKEKEGAAGDGDAQNTTTTTPTSNASTTSVPVISVPPPPMISAPPPTTAPAVLKNGHALHVPAPAPAPLMTTRPIKLQVSP